jgi:hypothetical protein
VRKELHGAAAQLQAFAREPAVLGRLAEVLACQIALAVRVRVEAPEVAGEDGRYVILKQKTERAICMRLAWKL